MSPTPFGTTTTSSTAFSSTVQTNLFGGPPTSTGTTGSGFGKSTTAMFGGDTAMASDTQSTTDTNMASNSSPNAFGIGQISSGNFFLGGGGFHYPPVTSNK